MIEKWMHEKLKEDIGEARYRHSVGVMNTSIELAKRYGYPVEEAALAGFLHDCGKIQGEINLLKTADDFDIILDNVMRNNIQLIHGPLGEQIAIEEYHITNRNILDAIRYHTTGRENMTLLEKIVYMADIIEPGRSFDGVDKIRQLAYEDLDHGLLYALDRTIIFVVQRGLLVHLDTIKARNQLIILKGLE
ncbi:bis(5'-nucleosyl)-tetraphosphatase (symmetrical) YqeK [Clostridium sp. Cult3]|uniref:bis(5'-nucleosyl)-tetraphosphatase (symmetrical) YqeK n=1 Tax=Clostridium sp. Cult3 TaxID=2079004 RepID=UPI001F42DBB4|nr:bis(5'-nucleosyl)-tetraphosphatase (symmetrical) YqeK [Clostridium sp. Cult3]MCF6460610.1 phosphohydrolase [Clostridium sp. Cult3]